MLQPLAVVGDSLPLIVEFPEADALFQKIK